jgi:hypothetical protein
MTCNLPRLKKFEKRGDNLFDRGGLRSLSSAARAAIHQTDPDELPFSYIVFSLFSKSGRAAVHKEIDTFAS